MDNETEIASTPGLKASMKPQTMVLHYGYRWDPTTRSTAVPIYATNAYAFPNIEEASDIFDLRQDGRTYTRLMNPTTDILEKRLAALEGGDAAMVTASGQAAIALAVLNLARAGDNIVSSAQLYGGTINLLGTTLARLGITTHFVDSSDPDNFAAASDERTRCYFGEALPNPMLRPFPIRGVAAHARRLGIPLIIDNTLSPLICRPLDLGAHIVIHSISKYICGHSTAIGGVVVDGSRFDWAAHADRFPAVCGPDEAHGGIRWLRAASELGGDYGRSPYLLKMRNTMMRDFGACPSPFNSFLFLQGLETLPLRMAAHCANAEALAHYLAQHPKVSTVSYPKLFTGVDRDRARENMGDMGGPLLQFELAGGISAGRRFIEALKLIYHVSNIGDARTLATHPASTTHASVSPEARRAAGVTDGTIRLSVGIEHMDDILEDLDQALGGA